MGVGPREGQATCEQLEEQHPQGIDICLGADRFGADLFGGDVSRRADDSSQQGVAGLLRVAQVFSYTEVSQVSVLILVEQNVGGFEVAVG